jgi:hypothetical protein
VTFAPLFWRKMLVAFLLGVLGTVSQWLSDVGPAAHLEFSWRLVAAMIATGGLLSALRAAMILVPLDLVPSDSVPIVRRTQPKEKP